MQFRIDMSAKQQMLFAPFWDLAPAPYDGLRADQSAAEGNLTAPPSNSVQPEDKNHI